MRMRYFTCGAQGCDALINRAGYCDEHKPAPWNGRRNRQGYRSDRATGWEEQRAARQAIARTPYCVMKCGRLSSQADHWLPLQWGALDVEPATLKLRGMCDPCHLLKTSEEAAIGRRYPSAVPVDVVRAHLEKWSE